MESGNANMPESPALFTAPGDTWRGNLRRIRRWPLLSVVILGTLVFAAVSADLIAPHDPVKAKLSARRAPLMWEEGGSDEFILGGDLQGRDVLSRIIHGARVSLLVAGSAISIGLVFGTMYGLISGYFGGWIDEVLMRIVEIFLAIPLIMAALFILVVAGASYLSVIGVLVLFSWVPFARQVRAETLAIKVLDYVALARVVGAPTHRILIRHILPGVLNTVIVVATLQVGSLILTESILSFLGVGIPPPTPAWGAMVADGRNYLASSWGIAFFPGMAIFLTVVGFNFMGDWIRDSLDPRLRQLD